MVLHVSQDPSDGADFNTLIGARDHLRSLPRDAAAGATVVVHPGTYYETLILDAADSGSPGRPITWRSLDGNNSLVSGGVEVPRAAFSPVSASSPLVRADLYSHGLTSDDLGTMITGGSIGDCQHNKTDLVFGGIVQMLGRWPNTDTRTSDAWAFANIDVGGTGTVAVNATVQATAAARAKGWAGAWLHGYWTFDWTDSYVAVANVTREGDLVSLGLRGDTATPIKENARFYVVNALSEVDAPGEYFIDEANGTLWWYPPAPVAEWGPADTVVLTSRDVILDLTGAKNIEVAGLTVADGRGVGVRATGVANVTLRGLTVRNLGQTGVVLDGTGSALVDSAVHDTGCVGVQASGGDPLTLTPGGTRVARTEIRRPAQWKRTYMAGLRWGGVGNEFINNTLTDGPHNCALGGGNELWAVDCLWEGNVVSNCGFEASDTGAWYSCGQQGAFTNRGNVAVRNTFSHIRCGISGRSVEGCGGGVQAVYLDDQMSGWHFDQNRFVDCDVGFFIGGGRRTTLSNSTFVNCSLAVHLDNRGMGWEKSQCGPNGTSVADVEAVLAGPAAALWSERWPELTNITDDDLCVPVYNRIVDNRYDADTKKFMDASPEDAAAWRDVVSGNSLA